MKPNPNDLERRVAQLEAGHRDGPLSPAEHAELDQLELEYQALFPVPIADMTDTQLDELLEFHRSDAAGRHAELQRRRGRTPEETARSKQLLAQLDRMTADQAGAWLGQHGQVATVEDRKMTNVGDAIVAAARALLDRRPGFDPSAQGEATTIVALRSSPFLVSDRGGRVPA